MDRHKRDKLKILVLEDNIDDLRLIQGALNKSSLLFSIAHVSNRLDFINTLSTYSPDIILSDHTLPQFDSLTALEIVKENYPHIPFILVTGSVSEEFAVRCIKTGAEDYVLKDNLIRLPSIIENAIGKKDLKNENSTVKNLNEKLRHASEIIARKNKDVTDSINYAKRIQQAIMPHVNDLCSHFSESFILHKPKDIVSGDFYWFEELDDKFIIAVGDCTGHGVPGALLSMIGYHLLKNTVYLKNITDPSGILNNMNQEFKAIFDINRQEDTIYDGMDLILCSIDKINQRFTFSSARRPLYFIRDGKLNEIKGSNLPIGGEYTERLPYWNETIDIKKGDKYYLFTDGYADQFGGTHQKKLKLIGLRNLITKTKSSKMSEMKKTFQDFFDTWKGKEDQTDDVLVIGIEIT